MHNDLISPRATHWLSLLSGSPAHALNNQDASIQLSDAPLGPYAARWLAVAPDPEQRFVRARQGEVGLDQGWALAQAVQEIVAADQAQTSKRALIAIIDVPSQAYGRREEAYGIHLALAAAADAYASARLAGHPVIGLLVGQAMSGAFLAHGYQAQRLLALDDTSVMTHAMGKAAAARVTLRSVAQLEALAANIPPMAYDIQSYAQLGQLWRLLSVSSASQPTAADVSLVQQALIAAIQAIPNDHTSTTRGSGWSSAATTVRARLREQW